MKIILWGYMGSGKTSIGKLLASTLQYSFLDLDNEIEREESLTISALFKKKGEIYFRRKEHEVLKKIISSDKNIVLSLGGGTPLYSNIAAFLTTQDDVITIYLSANSETLTGRLLPETHNRPLINHCTTYEKLTDFIRKHLFERLPVYSSAKLTIQTDNKKKEEIVETIVSQLF